MSGTPTQDNNDERNIAEQNEALLKVARSLMTPDELEAEAAEQVIGQVAGQSTGQASENATVQAAGQNLPASSPAPANSTGSTNLPAPSGAPPAQPETAPAIKPSFFFKDKTDPIELQFMSEADQALYSRGAPRAYLLSIAVVLFFGIFFLWGNFTRLDILTRATGKVVSDLPIQKISYLEGGVLEELLVKNGDTVEAGQVVARVSNSMAASSLTDLLTQQAQLQATVIRLMAEKDDLEPEFSEYLKENYPQEVRGQQILYESRQDQLNSELRVLESQISQREREVEEAQARQKGTSQNLALATQRRDAMRRLVDIGAYSKMDFLRDEQAVVSLRSELDSISQSISRARSAVEEATEKLNTRQIEWESTVQAELNTKNNELSSVNARLNINAGAVQRSDIKSNVAGKVRQIIINTIGGTVQPGATIMEILPLGDKLLVEGRVAPSDRAFLRTSDDPEEKQKAVVKITSYDFSIYGGLDATLEYISEDTLLDEKDPRSEPYYEIRLLTENNAIIHNGKVLPIMPGMTASIDIITGKRTVLEYLLKPIIKATSTAMREP